MGFTGAILGAALAVGGSAYTQHQARKAQKSAEAEARENAKRNVTVQASGGAPVARSVEGTEAGEVARQNARKRRQGMAQLVGDAGLSSGLVGGRSILGG